MALRQRSPFISSAVKPRRVRDGEGMKLRDIRLQLLTDVPWRAEDLARERCHTGSYWRERARCLGTASDRAAFVYEDKGLWAGIVEVNKVEQSTATECEGLWVNPFWRGRGVGVALLETATDWARTAGSSRVCAWVRDKNEPAKKVYVKAGFAATGEVIRWPARSDWQILMACDL